MKPLEDAMYTREEVDCYYFSSRKQVVYIEKPNPFTWYMSCGFHSVFWPALFSALLLVAVVVKKLFNIAKSSAQAAANNANQVPPTYIPNLYVIGSESAMGIMLGVEKSPTLEGLVVEASNPSAPEILYLPPPSYPGLETEAEAIPEEPDTHTDC